MSKTKRERPSGTREESSAPKKKVKISQTNTTKPKSVKAEKPKSATSKKSAAPKAKASKKYEETEEDSDPIVESDTQSESGADDGVSWPSDPEEEDAADGAEAEDYDMDGAEEDGGVSVSAGDAKTNGTGLSTSRESHQKQKALAQERKAARPNADIFARAKKIWERLRLQSHVPLPERKKLVAELFEIISGRVKDFVLKHDASRVIQTALKYGNLEERKMIARELKGTYCELAQSKFAKHAIGKILVHGDDEIRDIVIPEFFGNVRKLIKHPEASWILDDVYRGAATPEQKAILLREWYGAEYAVFKQDENEKPTADLVKILETSPEKKTPILRYLFELINQLIQKKTTGFTMLHDAMLQYYIAVRGSDVATEFLEVVKGDEEGDLLKNLAFTKSGARLVCFLLAYSSAKDRKQILKAYKGVISAMAYDIHAHKVLVVALDVVDDTRLTGKSIYGELLPPPSDTDAAVEAAHASITDIALHKGARTVLLYPFVNKIQSILPKDTEATLLEAQEIRKETSKKDPEIRREELAKFTTPQLLAAITTQAPTLIQESFGCQFITETLLSLPSDTSGDSKSNALTAILNVISDPESVASLQSPHAGRMLKSLVLSGHFSPVSKSIQTTTPALGFADRLFTLIKDDILSWATGVNSFTVVGLAETKDLTAENKKALKKILSGGKKELKAAAKGSGKAEGKAEATKEKGKDGKEGKDAKTKEARGNKGAEVLLSKIESGEL